MPGLETKLFFSLPAFPRDRAKWGGVDKDGMRGWGDQFMCLREAHIPNLSLLLCLEAFEKFLVGWWWWGGVGWSRPVLGFSLSQAEQLLQN